MKKMMMLVVSVVLLVSVQSKATVIFDGGPPNQFSGNEMAQWLQAEDFLVTQPNFVLTDARFWTIEEGNKWDGTLHYYIFNDIGGKPAETPIATGNGLNVVKTATGNVVSYLAEFSYGFNLESPFALAANTTYWFGLHLATDFLERDDIYWETTGNGFGKSGMESMGGTSDNWISNSYQHAFVVNGVTPGTSDEPAGGPVPEPATLLLLGLGLVGLAGVKRKFNK